MSSKIAKYMRWHSEDCTKDGCIQHLSVAWQTFDYKHTTFFKDPRNVIFMLTSNGFNHFKNMSVAHSAWPILLIPYNLPPWMGMK